MGLRIKGGILFPKRIPPLNPPEKGEGRTPRPPTLAVCSVKSCTRCAIGCGVHGFAMDPCELLLRSTAPYYREARVTVARRQTACGIRHCCARRIDECSGRRKLVCTTARQAERQRIVGAEASRLAALNAATPRYGQCNRQASHLFELLACNGGVKGQSPLRSLGGVRGPFSHVREWPPFIRAVPSALLFPIHAQREKPPLICKDKKTTPRCCEFLRSSSPLRRASRAPHRHDHR